MMLVELELLFLVNENSYTQCHNYHAVHESKTHVYPTTLERKILVKDVMLYTCKNLMDRLRWMYMYMVLLFYCAPP